MKTYRYIVICITVSLCPLRVFADSDRAALIGQALDCFARYSQAESELDWQDFCVTQKVRRSRSQAVDESIERYDWNRLDQPVASQNDDWVESEYFHDSEYSIEPKQRPAYHLPSQRPSQHMITPPTRRRTSTVDDLVSFAESPSSGKNSDWLTIGPFHQRSNSYLELGTEMYHYTYREPGLMRMKNPMYGLYGVLAHRFREHVAWGDWKRNYMMLNMVKVDGRLAYGQLDYESEGSGTDDGRPNYVTELRAIAGCDLPVMDKVRITPYFGFGFRYLLDDGGGRLSTTNSKSYDRESHYWYMPMGVESLIQLDDHWSIEWSAEYDHFIKGLQKSHIGDVGQYNYYYSGYPDVEKTQDSGSGARGSIRAIYQHPRLDIMIEPYVRYWTIDRSDPAIVTHKGETISWIEPKNNTTEYGLKFGVRY